MAEGRAEGKASLLLHMLERRFDRLPEWVDQQVRQAGDAQLDAWADALLEARSLEDVFGRDRRH
jgi:hypothetical protein